MNSSQSLVVVITVEQDVILMFLSKLGHTSLDVSHSLLSASHGLGGVVCGIGLRWWRTGVLICSVRYERCLTKFGMMVMWTPFTSGYRSITRTSGTHIALLRGVTGT